MISSSDTTQSPGHRRNRTPRPRQPRVIIIGASITGLTAALLCRRAGIRDIRVLEAIPATARRYGGLIGLEHSSLQILETLGIDYNSLVCGTEDIQYQDLGHPAQASSSVQTYPGRNTTWTRLHEQLLRHHPADQVDYGSRVTGLGHDTSGIHVYLGAGRTHPADLIIFADGRNSTGRRELDPGRRLHYAGYVAHRGRIATPGAHGDFLRFNLHGHAQFNIAPAFGELDWTYYLPASIPQYQHLFGVAPTERAFHLEREIGHAPRDLVDQHARRHLPPEHALIVHATTRRTAVPVLDIDPPTRMVWSRPAGHFLLLGDALAPVRPHTARGANNGIEQAAGLATALRQHLTHGADLTAALNGWQRRHLPIAVAAVETGPRLGARLGLGAHRP